MNLPSTASDLIIALAPEARGSVDQPSFRNIPPASKSKLTQQVFRHTLSIEPDRNYAACSQNISPSLQNNRHLT